MSVAISDVVAGALNQQMRLDILSNNLANINTIGYKKDEIIFGSNPSEENQPGATSSSAAGSNEPEAFYGSLPARTFIDLSQGHLESTGNKLDVALSGDGFFCIETADGIQYTRKGNFIINEQKELCTTDGYKVMGKGGKITIENTDVSIDEKGNIFSKGMPIESLKIVDFDKSSLIKGGNGLFSKASEEVIEKPAEEVNVLQGYIEQSNVNAVKMMTEMIDTLRGYESYQKIIQFLGDTTAKAINEVGQTA
jgi:flagellar basal-body rod protein FlgF